MIVKPATKEILDEFYGTYPTMKALAVVDGEQILAIAGFYTSEGHVVVFSDIKDELRERKEFKRVVIKAYRTLLKLLKNTKLSVLAEACPNIEGSDRLLEHMGFKRIQGDIFQWQR